MIKSTELRIGNWVYVDLGTPSLTPHCISERDMVDICSNRLKETDIELISIPLSPEILTQWCGFESGDSIIYLKSPIQPREDRPTYLFYCDKRAPLKYSRTIHDYIEIIYLHQLQNLYFALTGIELEVKIPTP